MEKVRIVLKGRNYQAPQAESVEIKNQGVLCASVRTFTTTLKNFQGQGF